MSQDDHSQIEMRDLMLNSAQARAAHYRQQAADLRSMAENRQANKQMRSDLLDLATSYDALANSVSAK